MRDERIVIINVLIFFAWILSAFIAIFNLSMFKQTSETYKEFIGTSNISFGGNNFEVYFEEDDFDKFADRLKEYDIEYVHPIIEHSWGQRVVRFYDPDKHIIEVGENMKIVCKRFLNSGMTPEQVAERMDVPIKFINACINPQFNPQRENNWFLRSNPFIVPVS